MSPARDEDAYIQDLTPAVEHDQAQEVLLAEDGAARPARYSLAMLSPTFFTRLGVPWLWGGDVEKCWIFMRFNVVPITMWLCAPGSYAYGTDRLPRTGGAVLAVNHLSAIDPPLVGSLSNRAIWYMMKSELLEIPVVGEALTWAGAFPIRRGESDRDGLRKAVELVRAGHVVGVFAEGTRQRFGYPGPIHSGAVGIALKASVPVIPCGVESFGWSVKNRRACCVVYGEAMALDGIPATGVGQRQAGELVQAEILRLWRQAAEAVAAGFPEVLPDGTARHRWPRFWEFHAAPTPRRISGLV